MAAIKKTQINKVSKDVEKLEPSYIAGRNIKWFCYCGVVWQFIKKLNMGLPYGGISIKKPNIG